ncbi:MAG: CMD domain protein [Microbacterium sp.]
MADIIDLLAGIAPGSRLEAVRNQRPQARENAQRSFEALLEPADPGTFPLSERYAVAAFAAGLHGFDAATAFYRDLLGDEAPELVGAVDLQVRAGASRGPYGVYREPGLAAESVPGEAWAPSPGLDSRLAAAFAHVHLLVFRPREASAAAIRSLADAGWSANDIVSLSQLVAFLAFQLRLAWGLKALRQAQEPREAA